MRARPAAEDEAAWERAKIEAVGHLVFDGPANVAREAAIVQRLITGRCEGAGQ